MSLVDLDPARRWKYDLKRYYYFPEFKFNLDKSLEGKGTEMKSTETYKKYISPFTVDFLKYTLPRIGYKHKCFNHRGNTEKILCLYLIYIRNLTLFCHPF